MTRNRISLWPQNRVNLDCLITIGMDLTAPFLSDMGLCVNPMEPLRQAIRRSIDEEPDIVVLGKADQTGQFEWLDKLDRAMESRLSNPNRDQFWLWIRDTYTFVPADRPNWERYEMFFFQWSVSMRDGNDNSRCFRDPIAIHEAYEAFVRSRETRARIQGSRRRKLSAWDETIFPLRHYTNSEAELDSGEYSDPFGVVEITSTRHHFQQFWEHILPQLSTAERQGLYDSMLNYYRRTSFLNELIRPDQLSKSVR